MHTNSLVSISGLVLDITGSWFLARGLIKKSSSDIQKETGFTFGQNNDYVIGGLHQKVDSKFGFWFLFFGFLFQAISYVVPSGKIANYPVIDLVIITGTGILVFWISNVFSNRNKRTQTKGYMREYISNEYKEERPTHPEDIKRYFQYLGFEFKENMPLDEQWNKFRTYLN